MWILRAPWLESRSHCEYAYWKLDFGTASPTVKSQICMYFVWFSGITLLWCNFCQFSRIQCGHMGRIHNDILALIYWYISYHEDHKHFTAMERICALQASLSCMYSRLVQEFRQFKYKYSYFWQFKAYGNGQSNSKSVNFQQFDVWQRCQPLRFWRNDYYILVKILAFYVIHYSKNLAFSG